MSTLLMESATAALDDFERLLGKYAERRDEASSWLAGAARGRLTRIISAFDHNLFLVFSTSADFAKLLRLFQDRHRFELIRCLPTSVRDEPVKSWVQEGELCLAKLVVAFLLVPPHQLSRIEDAFFESLLTNELEFYISSHPKVFVDVEERDAYLPYLTKIMYVLSRKLAEHYTDSNYLFVERFLHNLKTGTVYSIEGSLREFAVAKAGLIENYLLRKYGTHIADWSPLPATGSTRRIGILWDDVDRRTENIVGVASCRNLKDAGFYIVSVILREAYTVKFEKTMRQEVEDLSDQVIGPLGNLTMADKVAKIRSLDLDLVLIMSNITWGFSDYIALCSYKLGRHQAVNFCAVFTTGFKSIDTYVSGLMSERGARPAESYTERLLCLPGSCLVFAQEEYKFSQVESSRQISVRDSESTIFASGANFYKIHPGLTRVWAEILAKTPNSRLVLYPFNPNWDRSYPLSVFKRRFHTDLVKVGADPDRVTIAGPWNDVGMVRQLLDQVDIYLDSFPHSGGLSSLDALAAGVPAVTKSGIMQRENQTADLLQMMGLERLVGSDERSYVDIACKLALDYDFWASAHLDIKLRFRDAACFDSRLYAQEYARCLEELFLTPKPTQSLESTETLR